MRTSSGASRCSAALHPCHAAFRTTRLGAPIRRSLRRSLVDPHTSLVTGYRLHLCQAVAAVVEEELLAVTVTRRRAKVNEVRPWTTTLWLPTFFVRPTASGEDLLAWDTFFDAACGAISGHAPPRRHPPALITRARDMTRLRRSSKTYSNDPTPAHLTHGPLQGR